FTNIDGKININATKVDINEAKLDLNDTKLDINATKYDTNKTELNKNAATYGISEIELDTIKEKIKQDTRNYAKRQITWFKKYDFVTWFDCENTNEAEQFIINKLNCK
ncbi:MAG: hypothetical protein RR355_06370, partial [Oscillospiraceae bacterium]